jgi:hypothetical protein
MRPRRVAEAAFAQSRKTLRNSMRSSLGVKAEMSSTPCSRSTHGIDGASRRAETLTVPEFLRLGAVSPPIWPPTLSFCGLMGYTATFGDRRRQTAWI